MSSAKVGVIDDLKSEKVRPKVKDSMFGSPDRQKFGKNFFVGKIFFIGEFTLFCSKTFFQQQYMFCKETQITKKCLYSFYAAHRDVTFVSA